LEGKERWGKGILINRLLLFLGLLGAMILLAGFLFSKGDRAISTAQADDYKSSQSEMIKANHSDSLTQVTEPANSPTAR
jgi:hypothetical protein